MVSIFAWVVPAGVEQHPSTASGLDVCLPVKDSSVFYTALTEESISGLESIATDAHSIWDRV
jgi:hypothetical protein